MNQCLLFSKRIYDALMPKNVYYSIEIIDFDDWDEK